MPQVRGKETGPDHLGISGKNLKKKLTILYGSGEVKAFRPPLHPSSSISLAIAGVLSLQILRAISLSQWFVQGASDAQDVFLRHVGVDHGGLKILMAQQQL
jgi:hypothetical protein